MNESQIDEKNSASPALAGSLGFTGTIASFRESLGQSTNRLSKVTINPIIHETKAIEHNIYTDELQVDASAVFKGFVDVSNGKLFVAEGVTASFEGRIDITGCTITKGSTSVIQGDLIGEPFAEIVSSIVSNDVVDALSELVENSGFENVETEEVAIIGADGEVA